MRAHVGSMNTIIGRLVAAAAAIAMVLIAGCQGIPQDGRYQTHDGGRSNWRAEAPSAPVTLPS